MDTSLFSNKNAQFQVIGWDLKRVAQRLGQKNEEKLRLIVNKRPRDTVPLLIKNAPKALSRPLATMAPGSQTGYSSAVGRGFVVVLIYFWKNYWLKNDNMMYPLNRRRSSTFIGKLRDSPQTQSWGFQVYLNVPIYTDWNILGFRDGLRSVVGGNGKSFILMWRDRNTYSGIWPIF